MPPVNFAVLLGQQVDSAERPPTFPIGPYDSVVTGHEFGTSPKKQTPFVGFNVKLLSPREGVDEELFEVAGGVEKLSARRELRYDFYLTPDAMYRLREFLELGLGMESAGRAFDEMIPETTNAPFIAIVVHNPGSREGEVYMNIGTYAAAE
jgi:hypothetical protein